MNPNRSKLVRGSPAALFALLALAAAPSPAAEVWLQTGTTAVAGVPMWGYALCGSGSTAPASCTGAVTVPGPAITVPPGEGLIVHLTNTLPEPTSLVIAGQVKQEKMLPVWFEPATPATVYSGGRPAGNTSARVRSFDKEAAAGGGTATYTWAAIKPGTYLYSSGSHPQVQVQMGLYGAMSKDAGPGGVAYSQGAVNIVYSNQLTLLYSEVDPALHAAVNAGTYGSGSMASALEYHPTFFLINGAAYPDPSLNPLRAAALACGACPFPAGQDLLLRFLNAGLKTHVPTLYGQHWKLVAEDGNPVPFLGNPRQQATLLLPAGKTADVVLKPVNPSSTEVLRYAIFDSRHFDTSAAAPGGMLVKFDVGPTVLAPPVFDSVPVTSASAGVAYQYQAHATASNAHPVQYALGTPPVIPPGMAIGASTGLLTWSAANVLAGSYPVVVRATDSTAVPALSADQGFTIVVAASQPNRAPLAAADSYTAVVHAAALGAQVLDAPGVLGNDSDADGNPLTAVKLSECVLTGTTCSSVSNRVTLASNGGLSLVSSTSASRLRMTYQAQDNAGAANSLSNSADVTIEMVANRAPVAAADAFSVPRCTFRTTTGNACRTGTGFYQPPLLDVAVNDSDVDTLTLDRLNQLPLQVARVRSPATGSGGGSLSSAATASGGRVTIVGTTVSYVPPYNFVGTDSFQYRVKDKLGKESGSTSSNSNNLGAGWATVTLTVQ